MPAIRADFNSQGVRFAIPVIAVFMALPWCSNGQEGFSFPYTKRQLIIGPYTTFASFENFDPKFGLGVDAEYMLGGKFGFGGIGGGGPEYGEFSASLIGLIGLGEFQNGIDSNSVLLLLFLPFAFTNPCIHFKPSGNGELVLSIDLLQFKYIYEKREYYGTEWFASGMMTLRYSIFNSGNWQWSFFLSGAALYRPESPKGIQFGIAFRGVTKPLE